MRVYDLATATVIPIAEVSVVSGTGPAWSPFDGGDWSPDSRWSFGRDNGGTTIVFGRSDGSGSAHAITLDHPADSVGGGVAWQAVAP